MQRRGMGWNVDHEGSEILRDNTGNGGKPTACECNRLAMFLHKQTAMTDTWRMPETASRLPTKAVDKIVRNSPASTQLGYISATGVNLNIF
ncbi:MAG: hypothetical protein AAB329_08310 [Pseudomonadota bacterium]